MVNQNEFSRKSTLEMARAYHQAGLSIFPLLRNGNKTPLLKWKPYQTEQATEVELDTWFGGHRPLGIAVVTGAISGNLEVIDFDTDADKVFPAFKEQVPPELWEKFTVHRTPSDGYHIIYRVEGTVGSGTHLAMPAEPDKPIIETRGKGNYFVVPGTPAECHEKNKEYIHLEGPELINVQTIGFEDRAYLRALAITFDQRVPKEVKAAKSTPKDSSWEVRPGDAFNAKDDDWEAMLESEEVGFSLYQETSQFKLYTRPGKCVSEGCSASLGYCQTENGYRKLKMFSSSTKLDPDKTYDRFAFYTHWFHEGDFQAATLALYEKGYGKKKDEPDFEFTDAGNAAYVAGKFGNNIRYVVDESTWYAWDDRRWEKGAEVRVKALFAQAMAEWKEEAESHLQAIPNKEKRKFSGWNRVLQHATACRNTARVNAGVAAMALLPQLQCRRLDFNEHRHLLTVANGIIDLRTGELLPHDPSRLLVTMTPVAYDPCAEAPVWQECVRDIFQNDAEMVDFMHTLAGYFLTGENCLQILPFFTGEGGNGKGFFLRRISQAMGLEHTGTIDEGLIVKTNASANKRDEAISRLENRRMVNTRELDAKVGANLSFLKEISGGEEYLECRGLYQAAKYIRSFIKVVICTNNLPRLASTDDSMRRRVLNIPFNQKYRRPDMLEEAQKTDPNTKLADPSKEDHIRDNEVSGVLTWLVEGARKFYEQFDQRKGIHIPESVKAASKEYLDSQDSVGLFLEEACDLDLPDNDIGWSKSSDVHKAYKIWCAKSSERGREMTSTAFGAALKKKQVDQKRKKDGIYFKLNVRLEFTRYDD